MSMKKIRVDGKQEPLDYYVVRVQLVHAKRHVLHNWVDTVLVENCAIPNTRLEAANLSEELRLILQKHGSHWITVNLE